MVEAQELAEKEEQEEKAASVAVKKPDQPTMSDANAEEQDTKDKEAAFIEITSFLKKYNPSTLRGRPDTLNDRFLLKPNNLITAFSKDLATACEVVDEARSGEQFYAMIIPKDLPYRLRNIEELLGLDHPNILPLVAAGSVQFSQDDSSRMVAVHEMPEGPSIRELLESRKSTFSEQFIIDEVIAPIGDALKLFRERGISHGCINIDTVFLGDKVQLGECVSEPCGYAQHFHFESPGRVQAARLGKGEATIAADTYALGILVLHMLLGLGHFERVEQRQYLARRLSLGTYNTLVGSKEMKGLDDFLKGVLNDDVNERWGPEHIEQWVRGKKYNLLMPSVLREGQRPFSFMGEEFFNRRALANSIALHWEDAKPALRNTHLSRWVEVSLHKQEMADAIRKVLDRTGGMHSISEKANNELVTRTICLLDPEGPVRYNQISCFIDGFAVMLADAFRQRDQKSIQQIIEMMDYNFFSFIDELQDGTKNVRHGNLLWRLQNCSRYLRMPAMGFGIERILYELNPTLPCQSPLLANENVLTVQELLYALDRIGVRKSKTFEYLDRHIAAFLATKMDLVKEVKIHDLKRIPALAQNPQLLVIHMLAQAQRKAGKPKLKGLSSWAALRLLPLIDNFHSRTIRRKLRHNLKAVAKSGELDKMFELLADPAVVQEDLQGFQKAVHRFSRNTSDIVRLENQKRLKNRAEQLGLVFAMIIGYTTLLVTVTVVTKNFFLGI